MRRVSIDHIHPGTTLGADIRVPSAHPEVHYQLKLDGGTSLSENDLKRLKRLNLTKIPVEDPRTKDLNKYLHDEDLERTQDEVIQEFTSLSTNAEKDGIDGKDVDQLETAIDSLIELLRDSEVMAAFTTLKSHDTYTAQHSLDVAKISLRLALEFEEDFKQQLSRASGASETYIRKNMLTDLGMGAMLHDLGKRHVSESVLNKSEELTDDEWNEMTDHTTLGHDDLKQLDHSLAAPVKIPALQHHEKYDGTGYPKGLEGDEIHLFGRICSPADVYSALTSDRPYRDAKSPAEALEIMESMQKEGPHFDPDIFEKFKYLVFPYPIGEEVRLSDGSQGVVCDIDEKNPSQPTVRVLERDGRNLNQPVEVTVPNEPGELRIVSPNVESQQLLTA